MSRGKLEVCLENITGLSDMDDLFSNSSTIKKLVIRGDLKVASMSNTFNGSVNMEYIDGTLNLEEVLSITGFLNGSKVKHIDVRGVNHMNIDSDSSSLEALSTIHFNDNCKRNPVKKLLRSAKWDIDCSYGNTIPLDYVSNSVDNKTEMQITNTMERSSYKLSMKGYTDEQLRSTFEKSNGKVAILSTPRSTTIGKYWCSQNACDMFKRVEESILSTTHLTSTKFYYKLKSFNIKSGTITIKPETFINVYTDVFSTVEPLNASEPLIVELSDDTVLECNDGLNIYAKSIGECSVTITTKTGSDSKTLTMIVK